MKTWWVHKIELFESDDDPEQEKREDNVEVILVEDLPAALERVAREIYEARVYSTKSAWPRWGSMSPSARSPWIQRAHEAFYEEETGDVD